MNDRKNPRTDRQIRKERSVVCRGFLTLCERFPVQLRVNEASSDAFRFHQGKSADVHLFFRNVQPDFVMILHRHDPAGDRDVRTEFFFLR